MYANVEKYLAINHNITDNKTSLLLQCIQEKNKQKKHFR